MRTINMKNTKGLSFTPWAIKKVDITDRQPCWYVVLKNADDRENAYWIVGLKQDRESPVEIEINAAGLGDVSDDKFWNNFASYEFASKLLESFKSGTISTLLGGSADE